VIIIMGETEIDPAKMDEALPHLQAMMTSTHAEPGCLAYALMPDPFRPGVIAIAERWADAAALRAHFISAHMMTFNKLMVSFGVKGLKIKMYDASNERDVKL
jgi:quinol monooxygenase YgiN